MTERANDRRFAAIGIALVLAAGGLLLALAGAMVEKGFGFYIAGEVTIAAGLILMFVCLCAAGVMGLVGLVKEWLGLRN